MLLAAVRYVLTRGVAGHLPRLRELITTRYRTQTGRDIAASSVDALIALSDDRITVARFLALAATAENPFPAERFCQDGLARLGASANEALLTELTTAEEPKRIVKLARLLTRVSNVRSPQPLPTWVRADKAQRLQVVGQWRTRIAETGRLEPAPLAGPASFAPATTQAAAASE